MLPKEWKHHLQFKSYRCQWCKSFDRVEHDKQWGRYPSSINKKTFDLLSNGKNEVQVLVGPGGSSGNHLVVNGFDLSQQNYKVIQTGENVSMQVPATRNPTSWTASGLATGLTINNSGVISGTTTFIGDFNATVTAINADGNDSKVIQFRSIKGQRIITWDQNFTSITYGDAPVSLIASATGSDLNSSQFPLSISGLKLWLDAADLTSAGSSWSDKSGNNNHATKHNTPTVVTNAQNGLSLMRYETDGGDTGGSPDYHEWQDISDIRTVFCVIKRDADATDNLSQAIADDNNYHFFAGSGGNISDGTYAHANVRNGLTKLNGSSVTGTSVAFPTSLSVLTHRTTGNVEASRIGKDRHHTGRYSFDGDYGELLIFNSDLSDTDIAKIEGYLAHKWGLTGAFETTHSYKTSAPITHLHYISNNPEILEINGTSAIVRAGGTTTITMYAPANQNANSAVPISQTISVAKSSLTITGQDLTISQGAAVPTDLNYTVSGWKHNDASLAIGANPAALSNLALWLDASDSASVTHSSNAVSQWSDKSGNNKHATQSTATRKPIFNSSDPSLNNKGSVSSASSDGSIGLSLPSATLQEIFVIAYYKEGTDNTFDSHSTLLSGPGDYGVYRIMGTVNSAAWIGSSNFNESGSFKNGSSSSSSTALPMPATLLRFTSTTARTEARGILYNTQHSDRGWLGGVGEIIGLSAISSASDRLATEGYLAHKWGLSGSLPSNHSHKIDQLNSRPLGDHRCHQFQQCGYLLRPPERCRNPKSILSLMWMVISCYPA